MLTPNVWKHNKNHTTLLRFHCGSNTRLRSRCVWRRVLLVLFLYTPNHIPIGKQTRSCVSKRTGAPHSRTYTFVRTWTNIQCCRNWTAWRVLPRLLPRFACPRITTHHIRHTPHVSHATCVTRHMCHTPHVSHATCVTRHMCHTPHVSHATCVAYALSATHTAQHTRHMPCLQHTSYAT